MIRSTTLLATLLIACYAIDFPPMPPQIPTESNSSKSIPTKAPTPKPIDPCDGVPPMLFMLPPPLQADLDQCVNAMKQPKKESVIKNLLPQLNNPKAKVESIEPAEGFVRAYLIKINTGKKSEEYLCNETVQKCLKISK
ncbi:MAG: hypothetical protein K6347_08355 [Campylobacterales bacterium]